MESGVPFRYNHLGEGKPFKVKLDPTLAAFAVIMTIMVVFQYSVGIGPLRTKLVVIALLVSFFWIDVFLKSNGLTDSEEFLRRPIRNAFIQSHPRSVIFSAILFWGAVIYWRLTSVD